MRVIERALDLFAPHICEVCSAEGNPVCNGCQNDIATGLPSSCFLCNAATNDFLTCFSCKKNTPVRHVWTAAEYTADVKHVIARFKFERARAYAQPLASILYQTLPYFAVPPIVIFVPTATSRRRARGCDHAELLAKELGKQAGWDVVRLLGRSGQTRQVGSTRISRRQQLKTAYRPIRHELIRGQSIVLVDDITTTGATLTAAARALRSAGARTIDAAVIARKR